MLPPLLDAPFDDDDDPGAPLLGRDVIYMTATTALLAVSSKLYRFPSFTIKSDFFPHLKDDISEHRYVSRASMVICH
jgi:hypothetical protein